MTPQEAAASAKKLADKYVTEDGRPPRPLPTDSLLDKIKAAVAKVNEAEKAAETAKAELVSRSRVVGELLLEAKKRYPKVADFETFLKGVNGLKRSRAYDLMRLAGGRITDEQLREEARDRQRKSRSKKTKLPPNSPKAKPKEEPEPTFRDKPSVTESPTISTEQRRAEMAALDSSSEERAAKESARALAEFKVACRTWLPRITEEDDFDELISFWTVQMEERRARKAKAKAEAA
jgi:hypothetical protein